MSEVSKIGFKLQAEAIFDVPLQCYEKDFTFIVNGEEFPTNRFISDLLSSKISQQHIIDPTLDIFIIDTQHKGHFSYILDLVQFKSESPPESELPFLYEVLQILQNKSVKIDIPQFSQTITKDNVFTLIDQHSKNQYLYSSYYSKEIEFISSHFYEMTKEEEEKICNLNIDTIERILRHDQLQLRDENQLLNLVNHLYSSSHKYFNLYEFVLFSFVDENLIQNFIDVFDLNDITTEIWRKLSNRLTKKVDIQSEPNQRHYKPKCKTFSDKHDNSFDGIINYLRKESNGNIQNLIEVTSSSLHGSSYSPYNVCLFENQDSYFHSANEQNAWICFDFKEHKISPTSYILKSSSYGQNGHQPKSWAIEGSNDKSKWEALDEVNNCSYLNGLYLVHSFNITKNISKEFRYIRMRQTSNNWNSYGTYYYFTLGSIEFYGKLI